MKMASPPHVQVVGKQGTDPNDLGTVTKGPSSKGHVLPPNPKTCPDSVRRLVVKSWLSLQILKTCQSREISREIANIPELRNQTFPSFCLPAPHLALEPQMVPTKFVMFPIGKGGAEDKKAGPLQDAFTP